YTKFVKSLYFIMILVPTTSTLFPYTTLFRSRRPLLAWMESCNLSLRGDRPLLASLARPAFSPNAIDVPGFGKVARSAVGTGMSIAPRPREIAVRPGVGPRRERERNRH